MTTCSENNKYKHKAIFLDRDGVINVNRSDYVKSWDEFEFLPNAIEALKMINGSDYLLILITNQSPIGRGIFTEDTLDEIHKRMLSELASAGARIDGIYFCPHKPDDDCSCRKPEPGLILMAGKDFGIDLERSWMIGDSESDVQAGKHAGCRTAMVGEERSLLDVVKEILLS